MAVLESVHGRDTAPGDSGYVAQRAVESFAFNQHTSTSEAPGRLGLMPALQRFSGAVLEAPDLRTVEKLLVETVEQIFPTAIIVLSRKDTNNGNFARMGGKNLVGISRCMVLSAEIAMRANAEPAGTSMIMANTDEHDMGPASEWLHEQGLASYVSVPLVARAETLGHLSLYFKGRPALSDDEISFLATVAAQAAVAIGYARLSAQTVGQSAELRKITDELARSHSAKTEFLSVVSHEFRTPLNIIMGYAALMEEELVGAIGAEQRNCLAQIRNASHDLLELVMSLLQAGSLEAGRVSLKKGEVALGRLLEELRQDLRLADQENVELIWDVADDLPLLTTDAEKLKQVLHNLIDNALKFTERGQVRIWSKTVPEHRQVEIKVSDTGIGIADDVLPLVFDRYRQLDGSISRAYDGLGLGLFIAKKLTELLGGTLTVTSEICKGSTFTVALPLSV
jgi:signal transduction histidine kinase